MREFAGQGKTCPKDSCHTGLKSAGEEGAEQLGQAATNQAENE